MPDLGLLSRNELRGAFAAGAATAVGLAVVAVLLRSRVRPLRVGGLAIGAVVCFALDADGRLPGGLVGPLLLLAAAGLVAQVFRLRPWLWPVLAVPGAWALADHASVQGGWVPSLVLWSVLAGGTLTALFDDRWAPECLGVPFFSLATVGVLYTVPDTEQALVLAGAAVPFALLAWPWPLVSLGVGGSYVAVGVLAWTVAVGGPGREGSLVGGIASLGVLVLEPLARPLFHRSTVPTRPARLFTLAACAAQLGVVFVASRVAGTETTAAAALAVVLPAGVAIVVVLLLVGMVRGRARRA